MIQRRNIGLCILLTIITCGIYGIYWFIKLTDEINAASSEPNPTSGGMAFVLSIVTCGIYALFWMYKQGEKVDRMNGSSGNTGVVYLLLSIIGLGIVSYCLMQSELNKVAQ